MRINSAYLAAYRGGIAHTGCVTIVREALHEPDPALPAGASHFVDTRVDTGRSVPRQRLGQTLTNVDIRAAQRLCQGTPPVSKSSAWPG